LRLRTDTGPVESEQVDTMVGSPDDATLIAAAQAGDSHALDALLRRHYDRLWGLCRRLAGNPADAEDATQEALIAVARGLHSFDGRAAFTTWSYRVATNACLDELRRRARRPAPHASDDQAPVVDPGPQPDHVVDRLDVDGALARLPDDFRAVVVLRDLCDLEYGDIAELLDLPPGTVRSRIARGRAQLARHLGHHVDHQAGDPGDPGGPGPSRPSGHHLGNHPPTPERPTHQP
jgi:RNA polymerase sigma-70 factor (ECF subfamily)